MGEFSITCNILLEYSGFEDVAIVRGVGKEPCGFQNYQIPCSTVLPHLSLSELEVREPTLASISTLSNGSLSHFWTLPFKRHIKRSPIGQRIIDRASMYF